MILITTFRNKLQSTLDTGAATERTPRVALVTLWGGPVAGHMEAKSRR